MQLSSNCVGASKCLDGFRQIFLFDFEFWTAPGERPDPVCLVAWELRSGQKLRLWRDQLGPSPPYPIGDDNLFVGYYTSAELGCHRALGWPMPARVLDLFTEFRNLTNGLETTAGSSLLGALTHYGLPAMGAVEKRDMIALILRGGPWSTDERLEILDYCESDVAALAQLLPAMLPKIDLPRALLRGRSMAAAAHMEWNGVPIDSDMLGSLRRNWKGIQAELITRIDRDYNIYEDGHFRLDRFTAWLTANGIPWPRLDSGNLDLSDDTFRQQARAYPSVAPLRELRSDLAKLRLHALAVGRDGRNRAILSAFRSRTGRNQPSSAKFIFGPSVWLRNLIKPPPGYGVAYVDWSQQEFGIAAALSGDATMQNAYVSGDPYLSFAKQAGAISAHGTKTDYGPTRELYKTAALAVQYGMTERGLALRIGEPPIVATNLLAAHRQVYRQFWRWNDNVVDRAVLSGKTRTVFGWELHVGAGFNPRSLRNFSMQANGAEMLRLACCLGTERGVEICAPVHDAVLICAPLDRLHEDIAAIRPQWPRRRGWFSMASNCAPM
jgi:DNA polymerase I